MLEHVQLQPRPRAKTFARGRLRVNVLPPALDLSLRVHKLTRVFEWNFKRQKNDPSFGRGENGESQTPKTWPGHSLLKF